MKKNGPAGFSLSVISAGVIYLFLLLCVGCGGNPTVRNTYAYIAVAPYTSSSVAQFRVTSDGTLAPLNPPTVAVGSGIVNLVAAPDGNHVFAVQESLNAGVSDTFLRFSIHNDGTLAPDPVTSPASSGAYPFTLSPDGRFALVPWGNTVTTYSVSSSGQFTAASSVPAGNDACTVAIDPAGQFAYVGNFNDDTISAYRIAPDGTLTPNGTISTAPNEVYLLAFSPDGFLYSAGCCQLEGLTEYSIDSSSGALTGANYFHGNPFNLPWGFAFNPTGTYAYTANANAGTFSISALAVDKATGTLTANGTDIPTTGAYQIAVDPTGQFAFAFGGGTVLQFKISSTGTLVPNGEFPLDAGNGETSGAIAFLQR